MRGVEQGREYAILTDEITKAWSGMTTRQYKNLKGLKKENLRDNMSTTEIILTMLAETSTKGYFRRRKAGGLLRERQRCQVRRQGRAGCAAGVGIRNRDTGHHLAECRTAQSGCYRPD